MSDQTAQSDRPSPVGSISRRGLLRAAGAGAAVMGTGGLLQACSSGIKGAGSGPGGTKGITIGGKTYPVTIKSYDTQSSPTRAGDLARTAILSDGVNLLLASSTPETVNAVASQAESLHTPLICSNIPWEAWYTNLFPHGNLAKPTETAKYVVMYFL